MREGAVHQNKPSYTLLLAVAMGLSACTAAAAAERPGDGRLPPPDLLMQEPGGPEAAMPPGPGAVARQPPGPALADPPHEVIQTLVEIERLYREQGRLREVVALYQDVLGRTRDPLLRHFAYEAIARAQLQPAEADKAIGTLRQSLDESLQRLDQLPPPPEPHGKGL